MRTFLSSLPRFGSRIVLGHLVLAVFLASCARVDRAVQQAGDELAVLEKSAFYPVRNANIDSGYIPPPEDSGGGAAGGYIPDPGTSSGTGAGGTTPPATGGTTPPTASTTPGTSNPPGPIAGEPSAPGVTPTNPAGAGGANPPVASNPIATPTTPGSLDTGNVPGPGGSNPGDGGTILGGGLEGGNIPGPGSTPGVSNPPGTVPTSPPVASNPTPGAGGGGTNPPAGIPTDSVTGPIAGNPPANPTSPIDTGNIPGPGGSTGDGGTIPPVVINPQPTTPPIVTNPQPTMPPVASNPTPGNPVGNNNPPGASTPGTTGPIAGNTPNPNPIDTGSIPGPGGGTGDGGTITGTEVPLRFARVCSQRRSEIPYPQFIFYEEATQPVVSLEAQKPVRSLWSPSRNVSQWANMGPSFQWLAESLHRVMMPTGRLNLSQVNQLKITVPVQKVKAQFPNTWQQVSASVSVCDSTGKSTCAKESEARQLSALSSPSFQMGHIPSVIRLEVWAERNKTLARNPDRCEEQYSPILLDLTGEGIALSAPEEGVYFDLNDTGEEIITAWPMKSTSAFLVHDRNHDGEINSGAELFGSATRLRDGTKAPNGFEALKEYDSNGDGAITKADARWNELQLWKDRNRNGVSERRELVSLDSQAIESIQLAYITKVEVDEYGNETRERSTFRMLVDGVSTVRLAADIWFNTLIGQDE